nr:hypothetical protein B11E6.20 [imported] - Neurospora crassa [Neurospora crassa]
MDLYGYGSQIAYAGYVKKEKYFDLPPKLRGGPEGVSSPDEYMYARKAIEGESFGKSCSLERVARTDWGWLALPLFIGWSKYDLRECDCCGVAMLRFGRVKMVLYLGRTGIRHMFFAMTDGRLQDNGRTEKTANLQVKAFQHLARQLCACMSSG